MLEEPREMDITILGRGEDNIYRWIIMHILLRLFMKIVKHAPFEAGKALGNAGT